MPDFDVSMHVSVTFKVDAESADKAAWALRHAFDSRHSGDPMAGLLVPVPHVESARVMVCTFDALDRESVTVDRIGQVLPTVAPDLVALLARAESFISGFEGDELQTGIDDLLAELRAAMPRQ